jgi:hypothetical protein
MSQLSDLGIVTKEGRAAATAFTEIFPDFLAVEAKSPSDYVSKFWTRYEASRKSNPHKKSSNSLNGKVFEYLLASVFVREGLVPFFLNAKVAFVPNVTFDLMFYTSDRGPICISAKTSLRERYKQADLEAIALKYVHRKALSHLVTLNKKEASNVKKKIALGDVIGIETVVVANSTELDDLIVNLKTYNFCKPPIVKVIESNFEVTQEKVDSL